MFSSVFLYALYASEERIPGIDAGRTGREPKLCHVVVDGNTTWFTWVRHPSTAFSINYWSCVLEAFLNCNLKLLGKTAQGESSLKRHSIKSLQSVIPAENPAPAHRLYQSTNNPQAAGWPLHQAANSAHSQKIGSSAATTKAAAAS
ncbi:MAG: hypothetical protein DMG30_04540 [Acidobacteria bacterium]|nr:MAG: hypothetical protein DMG30_04540 [Acidobacteriota bacterium]